jgi:hypothetical protein
MVVDLRSDEFTAEVDINRKTTLRVDDDVDDVESAAGVAGGLSVPLGLGVSVYLWVV